MQRAAEIDWIRRFLVHLGDGTTKQAKRELRLPAAVFTSEAHRARERVGLFRRQPVVAGLSADLPEAGGFFCVSIGDVPVVVTRDREGVVRAFVNACRHRGAPVASGRGDAEGGRLRCPFHGWTYSIEGILERIPQAEAAFDSVGPGRTGLLSLACVEQDGLILVRIEGHEPIDGSEALRGVSADFAVLGLGAYRHFETRQSSWRCNWKLLLATFLESYHVFSLHRESVHPWYFSHPMLHDAWGPNLRFPVARRTLADLVDQPESEWRLADHATIQWFVAPNALFSATRDYILLWRFFSPAPGRTEIATSLYSAAPIDSEAKRERLSKAFDGQMEIAGSEDFPLQEEIQRGLEAGLLEEVVFGRNEAAAIHFHRSLAEQMTAADSSGPGL